MKVDWGVFIKEVEEGNVNKPSSSRIEFNNSSPCPDFEALLPEFFTQKDSSRLIDPKTGNDFRLSQSFISSLRDTLIESKCLRKLYYISVERAAPKDWGSSEAMQKGNRFEYLTTGAFDYHGDIPNEILTKTGRVSKDVNELIEINSILAKQTLFRNGIDVDDKENTKIDNRVVFKCLDGALDVLANVNDIVDLKYSGVLDDKWSPFAWTKENVSTSFGKIMQACLYSLLFILNNNGLKPTFTYYVFSNKPSEQGVCQSFTVRVSEKRFNLLKWLLLDVSSLFQEMITNDEFIEIPSYENCKSCPIADCKVKQGNRKDIEIEL